MLASTARRRRFLLTLPMPMRSSAATTRRTATWLVLTQKLSFGGCPSFSAATFSWASRARCHPAAWWDPTGLSDDVQGHGRIGDVNGPQDLFGVIHVDLAKRE